MWNLLVALYDKVAAEGTDVSQKLTDKASFDVQLTVHRDKFL